MTKRDFINKPLVRAFISTTLRKVCKEKGLTPKDVADRLPHHPSNSVRRVLSGARGTPDFFKEIAIAIGKSEEWYEQLDLDVCEFVLNDHDPHTFIHKFGMIRFENSPLNVLSLEDLSRVCAV